MIGRMDARSSLVRVLLVATAASALTACAPEANVERPPEPVGFVTVEPETISQTTTLTGEITARHTATYSFKTGGRVTDVAVDVGAKVTEGQVLAKLDPTEQQAGVAAAEAVVDAANAQLTQASSAFQRQKELLGKGFTTRGNFDDAQKALSSATSAVDMASADLETARTNLEETVLRADAHGVITSRSVDPGQVVSAAQTAFGFAEDGGRDAVFEIQEQLLIGSRKSHLITIALVGDPSVKTVGTVREVSPLIDSTTGTLKVKVGLDTVPPQMTLGSAIVGTDVGEAQEQAIVLPWTALMADRGKAAVWTVEKDSGAVRLTPVTIGSYQSGKIVVEEGIAAGDRVITEGSQLVRPGQIPDLVAMDEEAGS
ncbi:efflux RND transporter periplasmic adaptor subunit [Aurantimonas sp. C2-6-R+9]|uniref:efflux RND transporter periplasmic adaptor subunit n=1 Tax=unclassified Aurantimonas TaxID=2638230 RepID=UPI002E196F0B|nr:MULTISPECIES: efflux RND transporter periplasmic adaptor subunit [unclassified Aurantimonas]MEC5291815.1 efflux RND transporter periplasmic adaptor subunit [Aurantimonas sp. C2-3-R2]MEC5382398.1 efflux RND transporter periplasmic adaptor subunit [Aurantimonas sp. C2-6-R+9]MEC5412898.1 efflux RND transporter periplasmic adaptor subunit [Aurantimonas sp. C2-4-R8]